MNPNDTAQEDERHGWHGHHTVVHITEIIHCIGQYLEAKQRASAEELTCATYYYQYHGIAKTVAHTVDDAVPWLVHHGKSLKTSHEDTVGDYQSNIH